MTRIRPIREQIDSAVMRGAPDGLWDQIESDARDFAESMRIVRHDFESRKVWVVEDLISLVEVTKGEWYKWNSDPVADRCYDRSRFAQACLDFVKEQCRLVLDVDVDA